MIPYLILFASTIALAKLADKMFIKDKNKKGIRILALIVMLFSLLAGLRSYSVGTDVSYYVLPYFEKNYLSLTDILNVSNIEFLYGALIYLVRLFHGNASIALFFIEFISVTAFYYFFYLNRKNAPISISTIIYCFFFYNNSLSYMRQMIAVPFILLGYYWLKEKKYLRTTIFFAISIFFHFSSVIPCLLILIFALATKNRLMNIIKVLALLLVLYFIININSFLSYLRLIGILNEQYYSRYLSRTGEGDLGISLLVLFGFSLFMILLFTDRKKYPFHKNSDLYLMPVVCVLMYIARYSSSYIGRLALSFEALLLLFYLPKLFYKNNVRIGYRKLASLSKYLFVIIIAAVWFYTIVVLGADTYPYQIISLGEII